MNLKAHILYLLTKLFIWIISLIIVFFFFICYLLFQLFRQILKIYLSFTVPNYVRLLNTEELTWAVENISRNILVMTILVKYDKSRSKTFYQAVKEKAFETVFLNPEENRKMSSTKHRFLGYQYLMKDNLTIEDCFKEIDKSVIDEKTLRKYISEISNSPLPKDDTALWDVSVGKNPITWHEDPDIYAVVFRAHHSVGDAWSIANLFISTLCDPEYQGEYVLKSVLKPQNDIGLVQKCVNILKNFALVCWVLLNFFDIDSRQTKYMTTKKDSIVFDAKYFTGKKIVCFKTEKDEKFVPLCKEIRRNIGKDAKFVQIIFASMGHSLSSYFKQKITTIPDHMLAFVTVLLKLPKKSKKPVLENNFTVAQIRLPMNPKQSMLDSVIGLNDPKEIRKIIEDVQLNYLYIQHAGVFPIPIIQFLFSFTQIPVALTNFPSPPELKAFDGCEIVDMVSFPPNWGHCGITLCCTSFRNRFQMVLMVDTSIISKEEEAQDIVNNIFENFQNLNNEIMTKKKVN